MKAVSRNNLEILEMLIEAKASLDYVDTHGDTACIIAAREGHAASLEWLLAGNADVTIKNQVSGC
jgi:ankyrin repeat protein